MKKEINKEKGSVTLFVLISCIFFIIILLLVNIGIINKNANQEKELEEISKKYSVTENELEQTYENTINENGYLTPKEMKEYVNEIVEEKIKRVEEESFYKPGDQYCVSDTHSIPKGGYISSSATKFYTEIFLDKPMSDNVKSITTNSDFSFTARQNGNYLFGDGNENTTTGFTSQFIKIGSNVIAAVIIVPTKNEKTTNNDAVGIAFKNLTLNFN